MPVNSELLATLLAPVPGDNPSGKDLRYDPRYDRIKEARREDLDLPQGGLATERKIADWPQVVTLGTQLLAKETKDLQLGAWLTEALLKREGFGGLATGLSTLKGLLEQYWETLYPELDPDDLDQRTGPLEWIGSAKVAVSVRQSPVGPDGISLLDYQDSRSIPTEVEAKSNKEKTAARNEALEAGKKSPEAVNRAVDGANKSYYKQLVADLDAAQQALAALELASDDRFGRDAPGFSALRTALEDVARLAKTILAAKLEADPDPVVEEAAVLGPDAVGGLTPPEAGDGVLSVEPTSVADATSRVAAAARFLRRQDATNPAPYLMLRGLRWGELRSTPGHVEAKLLEAPPTPTRAKLKTLLLEGNWTELLEQGEALMATPQGRGWLDLQRYTLTACAQLGAPYEAVAASVRAELRALLAAIPRLPEMTLMDDTPTANPETREWIAGEGLDAASAEVPNDSADATTDGTLALDVALAEDDATSAMGGLSKAAPTRRGRATNGAGSFGTPADPFTLARAELSAKRPNRAIELLSAELSRERSPRGRFVRQTQIAYVMVEAGLDAVARPILERLVEEIDSRKLEDWEAGPLVAQPMALLCRVIDKLDGAGSKERNQLYLRVCRLDPLQAIALQG